MTNKTFGLFGCLFPMSNNGYFSEDLVQSEIDSIKSRTAKNIVWAPTKDYKFELIIPHTVYPPREDTDLMAKRIISLGSGQGKNFLEIGSGSGALSILASSLGYNVHCCDINPFAVSATIGNLKLNHYNAVVKEGGIGPEEFPFDGKFDLIIWNLPYIKSSDIDDFLGPMEDAALVDTDKIGLDTRLTRRIVSNQLLTKGGRVLILGRKKDISKSYELAHRIWDRLTFEDGEEIVICCLWIPFSLADVSFLETTQSTNDDVLNKRKNGDHVYAKSQTKGRGRKGREWITNPGSYCGSWLLVNFKHLNPGTLQLAAALAVVNTIKNDEISIKWPNDIMLDNRKLAGILVESVSKGNVSKIALGIGLNIVSKENTLEMAFLDEISNLDIHGINNSLNKNLASMVEISDNLPPIMKEEIISDVFRFMKKYRRPYFMGKVYDEFSLNERGELVLGGNEISDLDQIEWV